MKAADFIVAILLGNPDSDSELDVKIFAPNTDEDDWPKDVACIVPRGFMLRSDSGNCYVAMMWITLK